MTLEPEKVCAPCQKIADEIAELAEKIGKLERSQVSLRKTANQQDPNIQNALREDDAKIADLKSQKGALEAKLTGCVDKCKATVKKSKTEEPPSNIGKKGKRRTSTETYVTKKKARKDDSTMSPETARTLSTILEVGAGLALRRVGRHRGGDKGDGPTHIKSRSVPKD